MRALLVSVVLLSLYPLSNAPVCRALAEMGKLMEARPAIEFVYGPVYRICEISPTAATANEWYFEFWGF